jgi:hypothetical protein
MDICSYVLFAVAVEQGKQNSYFYTHQQKTWDALKEAGLGYIVDAIPFVFTRKLGLGKTARNLMKHMAAKSIAMTVSALPCEHLSMCATHGWQVEDILGPFAL